MKTYVKQFGVIVTEFGSVPVTEASSDYRRLLEEVAAGGAQIVDAPAPSTASLIAARKDEEYEKANALVLEGVDLNARAKYNIWLISSASSEARKAAIWSIDAWTDDLWHEYAVVRARILAGDLSARFTFSVPCPFTFWQIAAL